MLKNEQLEKFKAAVRELETNNDPEAFDRKMRKMKLEMKKPPKPKKPNRGLEVFLRHS